MYVLDLANTTETQLILLEKQLENVFINITEIAMRDVEEVFPYLAGTAIFLLCLLPYMLPCVLCKTIQTVPTVIYQILCCLICRKKKDKFSKADIIEIKEDEKTQKLIAA